VSRRTSRLPAILIAGAAGLTVRALYERFRRFEITEESMWPALQTGDYVVTSRSRRPFRRGDIVVFESPDRASFYLAKRVVGLPGEDFTIESGRVLINGTPIDESWTADQTGPDGAWALGPGEAFVLGDARATSSGDSREVGPVPLEHLRMRIVFRYWPLQRFGPVS
jgi:signal peptidase I